MIKNIGLVLLGFILCVGLMIWQMPSMMIIERESPFGFEETIDKITTNAKSAGWYVPAVRRIDKSVKKHGSKFDVPPTALIELCQPDYAGKIMQDDSAHFVSVMMPCTVSVYKKSDGKVYVSNMNTGLMGKMFGGIIAEVMGGSVSKDEEKMLDFLE